MKHAGDRENEYRSDDVIRGIMYTGKNFQINILHGETWHYPQQRKKNILLKNLSGIRDSGQMVEKISGRIFLLNFTVTESLQYKTQNNFITKLTLPISFLINHRKCQKAHSGIVSGRQGLGQARTLVRRQYKKP